MVYRTCCLLMGRLYTVLIHYFTSTEYGIFYEVHYMKGDKTEIILITDIQTIAIELPNNSSWFGRLLQSVKKCKLEINSSHYHYTPKQKKSSTLFGDRQLYTKHAKRTNLFQMFKRRQQITSL